MCLRVCVACWVRILVLPLVHRYSRYLIVPYTNDKQSHYLALPAICNIFLNKSEFHFIRCKNYYLDSYDKKLFLNNKCTKNIQFFSLNFIILLNWCTCSCFSNTQRVYMCVCSYNIVYYYIQI